MFKVEKYFFGYGAVTGKVSSVKKIRVLPQITREKRGKLLFSCPKYDLFTVQWGDTKR